VSTCSCCVSVHSTKFPRVRVVCNIKSRANPKSVCRVGHSMSDPVSVSCQCRGNVCVSTCSCCVSVHSTKCPRVRVVCNIKSRANPESVCRVGHAMSDPVSVSCQCRGNVCVSTCSCCNWQVSCQLETFGQLAQCCSALGTQLAVRSACNAWRV
jgi:hypothetical protein